MEFTSLNELNRLRHLGKSEPWSVSGPFQPALTAGPISRVLSPRVLATARDRAHKERALAFGAVFHLIGRGLKRLGRAVLTKRARGAARAG